MADSVCCSALAGALRAEGSDGGGAAGNAAPSAAGVWLLLLAALLSRLRK
jgi:hypothetical protein